MKSEVISRVGIGVSILLAVLLIIFFFLPWTSLKAKEKEEERTMGKASGMQLMIGTMTAEADVTLENEELANETIGARPWFILGLLVPLAVLLAAGVGLTGKIPAGTCGSALVVLGILGVIVPILATHVEYSDDFVNKMEEQMEEFPKDNPWSGMPKGRIEGVKDSIRKGILTSYTGIAWTLFALYILVLLGGVMVIAAPAFVDKSGKSCVPPPSEPSA